MSHGVAKLPLLLRTTNRAAPWLSLAICALAVLVVPQPPSIDAEVIARHGRIEIALSSVPLRIGEWIGEERPLTPAAVELLRPNAALSRSYRRIGRSGTIAVSLIHCSDFRDMAGHYPPVCYPAHGWSIARGEAMPERVEASETVEFRVDGFGEFPLHCYRFSRLGEGLIEIKMTVMNAFILPDGQWVTDLAAVRDGAARRRLSGEGVAQLQLVVPGWPSLASVREQCESLLSSLPASLFETLGARRTFLADPNGMESIDE